MLTATLYPLVLQYRRTDMPVFSDDLVDSLRAAGVRELGGNLVSREQLVSSLRPWTHPVYSSLMGAHESDPSIFGTPVLVSCGSGGRGHDTGNEREQGVPR